MPSAETPTRLRIDENFYKFKLSYQKEEGELDPVNFSAESEINNLFCSVEYQHLQIEKLKSQIIQTEAT